MQGQRILQYEATIDLDFGVKSINSDIKKAERNNTAIGPNFIIASKSVSYTHLTLPTTPYV